MGKEVKVEKIPKGALRFVEQGSHAFAISDSESPKLQMTAYNGKIIKGHWYWGDLAIDLNGMKFPSGRFPILENHNTDLKIGFHKGKPDTSGNKLELVPEKTQFVSTEAAQEFIKLSSEGFPYQASIYAKPLEIMRLAKSESREVNGFVMHGPGTVWVKSEFKEASVAVFGWDSQTKASAFSKEHMEEVEFVEDIRVKIETNEESKLKEGGETMKLEELKEKHPEIVTQLTDEVTNKVTDELTIIFGEEKKILTDENVRLSGEVDDSKTRLAGLEKKDALREERERDATTARIWTDKLVESDIGEHLWDKVKKMVSFTKFVKDGTLDVEAFSTAIDEEIKDWEKKVVSLSVSGMGAVGRTAEGKEDNSENKEENVKLADSLLSRAGQTVT